MHHALDVWSQAWHLVLDQSGRARLHDTRAALNSIALGLEVLRHDDGAAGQAMPVEAPRVLAIMHRDLHAAADQLTGLHALVTSAGSADLARLGAAVEWADLVTRPVARRCGVALHVPAAGDLPALPVDRHFALGVAVALIEGVLAAPRGGACALHLAANPRALAITWPAGTAEEGASPPIGPRVLDLILGRRDRQSRDAGHRVLTIELPRPS
ncbi:MAG: hypothetical protein R2752_17315 [Vicinamibacterales bacterium]